MGNYHNIKVCKLDKGHSDYFEHEWLCFENEKHSHGYIKITKYKAGAVWNESQIER